MKKILAVLVLAFTLGACDTFGPPPQPFPVWTPIPSRTPQIESPTPIILTLPFTGTPGTETPGVTVIAPVTPTTSDTPSPTYTATSITPTETGTPAPVQSIQVDILGCNTSIDILHGMGEVTNAFVTLKNNGTTDLPNACGLLRASDEGRPHPNKEKCVDNLPAQHQVTLKLTVDSTYKSNTAIQVDALSNNVVLLRVDKQSCRDISLFGGEPKDVGVIKPIQ